VYQKGTGWIEHDISTVSHRSSPVPSRNSFVYLVGYPDYADTPIPLSGPVRQGLRMTGPWSDCLVGGRPFLCTPRFYVAHTLHPTLWDTAQTPVGHSTASCRTQHRPLCDTARPLVGHTPPDQHTGPWLWVTVKKNETGGDPFHQVLSVCRSYGYAARHAAAT
jgi:hypothetical protein